MTAFTFGEATTRALAQAAATRSGISGRVGHRTGARVRRDSIEAGTFEDMFFATPAKGECDRLIRMARTALDAGRRIKREARGQGRALTGPEQVLASLTAGAVRVYEELCTLARLNAGRVYPSYDRLAAATALGRATVARALQILEDAGFLVGRGRAGNRPPTPIGRWSPNDCYRCCPAGSVPHRWPTMPFSMWRSRPRNRTGSRRN